jgi:N-acetylglutamate synthase-like GNAT family acetyltransferase
MEIKEVKTDEEFQRVFQLRVKVLRTPWNQDPATATDAIEKNCINAYLEDEEFRVLGCARLQKNSAEQGQIRFMAIDPSCQGKGLGKQLIHYLEQRAKSKGLNKIELQARENAVAFYTSCGYTIREKSFLLWGLIQHYLMDKSI